MRPARNRSDHLTVTLALAIAAFLLVIPGSGGHGFRDLRPATTIVLTSDMGAPSAPAVVPESGPTPVARGSELTPAPQGSGTGRFMSVYV
jgi:hypothetical protein